MIGHRRTHDFPNGRPRLLAAVEAATVVCWFAWMIWSRTFVRSDALRWMLTGALIAVLIFADRRITNHFERTGQAVALPPEVRTWAKYGRLPKPVLAVRVSFFVIVAAMLAFGLAPIRDETSHIGIIASVLALFVLGLLSLVLERHYINTGIAEEIPID